MWLFGQSIISTMHSLARRCPACRRRQIVPSGRKRLSVACRNCGAQIPPPNDHTVEIGHDLSEQRRHCRKTLERRWRL